MPQNTKGVSAPDDAFAQCTPFLAVESMRLGRLFREGKEGGKPPGAFRGEAAPRYDFRKVAEALEQVLQVLPEIDDVLTDVLVRETIDVDQVFQDFLVKDPLFFSLHNNPLRYDDR
jgi:hypothetical protein